MHDAEPIDRRTVLKRAGLATLGSVAIAGCSGDGGDGGGGGNTFGGWMSDANNYDGSVVDETGASQVTVDVGVGSNGTAFGPAAVRVSTGTDVRWNWTGQGGQHNVHATEGASFESQLYLEGGVHFTQTFQQSGTVKYQCDPHSSVGMKGVVVVE
ncbi:MAG: halocyanin domain-containing protein [Halobacteriaceae archaeon]